MHKEDLLLVKNIDKIFSVLFSIVLTSLGVIALIEFPDIITQENSLFSLKINFWLVTLNYFFSFLASSVISTVFLATRLLWTKKWDMSWIGVTLSLFHPSNFFIYIIFIVMGVDSLLKIKEPASTFATVVVYIQLFFGVYKLSFITWYWCCGSQKTSPHFLEVDSGAYSIQDLHLNPMVLELEESLKEEIESGSQKGNQIK